MATGCGGKRHLSLPARTPLPAPRSSLGAGPPLPGPCGCPWTGRTPWPSSPFSQSCIRMKGSRPFWVSLLQGFGRDSMSLTLPCDRPSTWNGNQGHAVASAPGSGVRPQCYTRSCVASWLGRAALEHSRVECRTGPWGVAKLYKVTGGLVPWHREP